MGGNWEALQEENMIKTLVLTSRRRLELTPDSTPPPLARLCPARAFAHVEEYIRVICALVRNTPVTPSNETMGILCFLHPLVEIDLPPFMDDFHPEMKVILY